MKNKARLLQADILTHTYFKEYSAAWHTAKVLLISVCKHIKQEQYVLSNHEQKEDAYLKLAFCVTFPSGLEQGGSGITEDVERMH